MPLSVGTMVGVAVGDAVALREGETEGETEGVADNVGEVGVGEAEGVADRVCVGKTDGDAPMDKVAVGVAVFVAVREAVVDGEGDIWSLRSKFSS